MRSIFHIAVSALILVALWCASAQAVCTSNCAAPNVAGFTGSAYQAAEIDNGDSGTEDTIDWSAGNNQKSTLTGNVTYTFTDPPGPAHVTLKMVQDPTGTRTVTWPAEVKWAGDTEPSWVTDADAVNLVFCYFDGSNYHCSAITGSQ